MAKLNHIRRYRFDDETNLALQKLGKKKRKKYVNVSERC